MARMATEEAGLVYFTHLRTSCERAKKELPELFRAFASSGAHPRSRRRAFLGIYKCVDRIRSRQGITWTGIPESRRVTLTLLALVDMCDLKKLRDTEILLLLSLVWPSAAAPRLHRGAEKLLTRPIVAN